MAIRDEAGAREALTALFGRVDKSGNKSLELCELQAAFGAQADSFLQFCDADKNKSLSLEEWLNGIVNGTASMPEEKFQRHWISRMNACLSAAESGNRTSITSRERAVYERDFARFDADGSHALTGDECVEMAKFQLGKDASDEQLKRLIGKIDTNNDGRIPFLEYLDHVLGAGWVVLPQSERSQMGKSYCHLKDVQATAESIYKNGSIPLIGGHDQRTAKKVAELWAPTASLKVVDTKPFVGEVQRKGQEGKQIAWKAISSAAAEAVHHGSTLVRALVQPCETHRAIFRC